MASDYSTLYLQGATLIIFALSNLMPFYPSDLKYYFQFMSAHGTLRDHFCIPRIKTALAAAGSVCILYPYVHQYLLILDHGFMKFTPITVIEDPL